MGNNFIAYRRFDDPALAAELTALLDEYSIAYEVSREQTTFNPTFYAGENETDYLVKIAPADFERANELLRVQDEAAVNEVESGHYLYTFDNEQLAGVLRDADEWSPLDYVLAKKILAERGVPVDEEKLQALKTARLNELRQPDETQTLWVVIGYVSAFLGGIIGIFVGWHLSTYTKTLPNGEKVPGYSTTDRMHGRIIFYLSLVVFIASFIVQLVKGWNL